ncbi:MBL fold metallo-hydrolase [Nocardioides sp. CPCC 206347]|uniref:MBL fold metallo-hydrolase n=1 Tax=unclassified Nocardioides TaxID=2615069 RepID=UPI00361CC997
MATELQYEVHVEPQIPQSGRGPLPDGSTRMWSPISSTLIMGRKQAILVDPPMTSTQAQAVVDWVLAAERQLTGIYITHGHADHWLGAIALVERFPDAVVYATADTQRMMKIQGSPEFRASFWDKIFPGQLPVGELDVQVIGADGFQLEGVQLQPVEVGHTDTDDTTMLHVADIGLLVAGDAVYNGVHPYLTESGGIPGIDSWLAALDVAADLAPRAVVAGHKAPDAPNDPAQIDDTRRYLEDARELLDSARDAQTFYDGMLARHPDRINPGALWGAAITLFPAPGA